MPGATNWGAFHVQQSTSLCSNATEHERSLDFCLVQASNPFCDGNVSTPKWKLSIPLTPSLPHSIDCGIWVHLVCLFMFFLLLLCRIETSHLQNERKDVEKSLLNLCVVSSSVRPSQLDIHACLSCCILFR